ncbi:MAG: GNAT family N-acetyltransferase [Anaerolineaceae bacterium]|nr:GNAT family N-acetyltransferase [Anaerolineaceae bacterium]
MDRVLSIDNDISLLPFQPADQAEVKQFVLAGLVEHWGFLDYTLNPDLNDIAASYADGLFLVALQDGRIVGTGALLPRSEYSAEIMRMSVSAELRRSGLGRAILQRLCREAKAMGFQKIILETTETWQGVIEFYLNFGFHITHHQDEDVYFALDLRK